MVELPCGQHIVLLRSAEDVFRGVLRLEQTEDCACREEKRGVEIDPSLASKKQDRLSFPGKILQNQKAVHENSVLEYEQAKSGLLGMDT